MTRTYHGSCHCGRVRFEVEMDFTGSSKCNCTFCWKQRNWNAGGLKPDQVRVLVGDDQLTTYSKAGEGYEIHHCFCSHCGTATHGYGRIDAMGGAFASVRVAALDDMEVEELVSAPTTLCDGLNDNWWNVPAETRHL